MQLSKYISDLLYRYECVMIPNFGGFVSNTIPSKIESNHQFTPPAKNISFNVNLQQNDGLLINHVAKALNMSFDKAADKVQETVDQWNTDLKTNTVLLDNIGKFSLENEQLVFEPLHTTNYLSSSFGLSSINADFILRNNTSDVDVIAEPVVINTPKKQYKKYIAAAAIIGGIFIGGNMYITNLANQQEIAQQQEITTQIQQASFNILNPLPAITLKVEKEEIIETETAVETVSFKYHIIAGAFKDEANAIKKVTVLNNKGYNASIIGLNKWGLTQVSYAAFNSKRDAINKLNAIRKRDNKHAWLYINE